MTDRKSLEAATKLVRRGAGQQPPSAEPHVPEIRSNMKWKATTQTVAAFRPEAVVLVVWHFGVPFRDIDGFHTWLAANEVTLANMVSSATSNQATYLGTYLHLDTGAPRYHTQWGLANESTAEDALAQAFASSQQLMEMVKVLRGYWSRDPGATDHRYGLARRYINVDQLPNGGAFWDVTLQSAGEDPQ